MRSKEREKASNGVSYDILDVQHAPLRSTDDDEAKKDLSLKTDEGLEE